MRFLIPVFVSALLASLAVASRAAGGDTRSGSKGTTGPVLEDADKRLSGIEKLLRGSASVEQQPSAEDLRRACRSSFTVTGMASAVTGWMAQGSPVRSALSKPGEFEAFSKKTVGTVIPMVLEYQMCLAHATGQRVCEPMQLLGPIAGGNQKSVPECGDPHALTQIADEPDDEFVFAMKNGRRDAARGYCQDGLANVPVYTRGTLGSACDAIIASYGDPAAACGKLKTLINRPYTPELERECLRSIGSMMGDAKTCPTLGGQDKWGCERRAAIRAGKEKPAKTVAPDKTCAGPIEKLETWYCGRFTWPAFERIASTVKAQTKTTSRGEKADRRAQAIEQLKAVNDLLAQVVMGEQMAPLSDAQKEKLDTLTERRDRLASALDDGKTPAPAPSKRRKAAKQKSGADGAGKP